MPDASSTKPIRVHILGREYGLRVHEDDESHTRQMAAFVNARMEQFKDAHPEQSELTTAVITALSLSEELHMLREEEAHTSQQVGEALDQLANRLGEALNDVDESPAEA